MLGANVVSVGVHGKTSLLCATENSHTEVVRVLLKKDASPSSCLKRMHQMDKIVNAAEKYSQKTALMHACCNSNLAIAEALLSARAAVNTHLSEGSGGGTALILAVESGNVAVIEALLAAGAEVNRKEASEEGWSALHHAANFKNELVVKSLLDWKADPSLKADNGDTPLSIIRVERLSNEDGAQCVALLEEAMLPPSSPPSPPVSSSPRQESEERGERAYFDFAGEQDVEEGGGAEMCSVETQIAKIASAAAVALSAAREGEKVWKLKAKEREMWWEAEKLRAVEGAVVGAAKETREARELAIGFQVTMQQKAVIYSKEKRKWEEQGREWEKERSKWEEREKEWEKERNSASVVIANLEKRLVLVRANAVATAQASKELVRVKREEIAEAARRVDEMEARAKEVDEQGLCSLCIEFPANVVLLPCGHVCMCHACSIKMQDQCCPICRGEVERFQRAMFS